MVWASAAIPGLSFPRSNGQAVQVFNIELNELQRQLLTLLGIPFRAQSRPSEIRAALRPRCCSRPTTLRR
jgi:hypothetical protein